MLKANRLNILYASAALLFIASDAWAAGFQLKEQGAGMQGLSFAGATAKADDLSTLFFNPAGMTRLEGNQAEATLSFIAPSAKFSQGSAVGVAGGNGGDAGAPAFVPAIYGVWDVKPDLKFGLSINTPFGLATEYKQDWAGRYYALDSSLMTINVSPVLAYKVNNQLSIGGGLQIEHAEARLTKATNLGAILPGTPDGRAILKGDSLAFGFSLGALYEFDEDTRVGVSYRSRTNHKLKGDLTMTGVPPALAGVAALQSARAQAGVSMPEVLSVGAYHGLNDQWAVMGDVAWTNWSTFDRLLVRNISDDAVREDVDENWSDTVFVAVGTEYKANDKQTWQFGIAYDQGAVGAEHRTFRIPDSDRLWLSVGYGHKLDDKSQVNIGYSYIFARTARVTEDTGLATGAGAVSGKYDANVNILSVGYRRTF